MAFTNRLLGRIAYVSGGAGGQGASHVERLAQEGAIVVFGDVSTNAGLEKQNALRSAGLNVEFITHDVRSLEQWIAVHDLIEARFGRLDILVNNAGVVDMRGAEEATEETWQRTIDINQKGVFLGIKALVDLLRKGVSPSIVNTASIYGIIGAPDYIAYVASKGAVASMSKAAALTYGPDGIRVNSIHPGYVETPMLREEFAALPEGSREAGLSAVPLRRFAAAEEISSVVAFLASDDASYISGSEIVIDGGLLAGR
ncbi:hypothetical protein ASD65_04825 [Microbacterium sp. Root61]|uniref:SDR family NAD(P)-dependent oxidoreductase n=1 Tax=Microbacterium sp. Root61 TaxID=1736570 RepID=UPI0006F74EC3|nr:SDR family oxidoreductase [Microbacterium sp. Root61]KRA23819.1 hypothetical protein ASD65_04825 [Microbacterium sp. Root61]